MFLKTNLVSYLLNLIYIITSYIHLTYVYFYGETRKTWRERARLRLILYKHTSIYLYIRGNFNKFYLVILGMVKSFQTIFIYKGLQNLIEFSLIILTNYKNSIFNLQFYYIQVHGHFPCQLYIYIQIYHAIFQVFKFLKKHLQTLFIYKVFQKN